ncbi:MAG: hypothetical protein ACJAXJ_002905 [Colwellia sp.]|jgi:hypothetical protein
MKKHLLLSAFVFVFVVGAVVGCAFVILFQGYLFIFAAVGFISLAIKLPGIIKKLTTHQTKEKNNATN